jgi:hypothetical protein
VENRELKKSPGVTTTPGPTQPITNNHCYEKQLKIAHVFASRKLLPYFSKKKRRIRTSCQELSAIQVDLIGEMKWQSH